MIVLDANLLLYAYDSTSKQHPAAKLWLQEVLSGHELIGLPWLSIWAFLRVSTNPRLFENPLPMESALSAVELWIETGQTRQLSPGERHWVLLQKMMIEGNVRGPSTTDAALAALTIEYGGILHTTDRGFARYPGLRWVNPLLTL